MRYPVVMGSGRSTVTAPAERCGGPPAVPTTICKARGSMLAQGALGVTYKYVAPVSAIAVSDSLMPGGGRGVGEDVGNMRGVADALPNGGAGEGADVGAAQGVDVGTGAGTVQAAAVQVGGGDLQPGLDK